MQSNETVSNSDSVVAIAFSRLHRVSKYQKVYDARKRRVRGLWLRNGRYYAQLALPDEKSGSKKVRRVPLEGAQSVAQAVIQLQDLQKNRRENTLSVLRRTPKFAEFAEEYFRHFIQVKDAKRESTLKTEKVAIRHWNEHLGSVRLDRISRASVNGYIASRQAAGICGRTVNLEMVAFRNVLKHAIQLDLLKRLPTENLRPLKWHPPRRELTTSEHIQKVCESALSASKNGLEFSDYIRLMACCGSRMSETLRLKWTDVDWQNRQLTVGADGLAKNHKSRVVDFNPKLETHLKEMFSRRAPDSQWLFPSPQRGEKDARAKTFRETLLLARGAAGLSGFAFHDCRHHFISYCVMSGIDFMTIARWVGHQDGGILIGKVYGHLSNEHAQKQAQRLNFEPARPND